MKPQETIDYHIKSVWLCISSLYNQIAEKHQLTQSTGFVLLNIDKEGTPATKIAPMMGMKATSLSRILKKLEDDQLIIRKQDEQDGRLVLIHLTEAGKKKKKIAKKVVKEFNQYILNHVNQDHLDSFFSVMESIGSLTEEYRNLKIAK